jgi:hypothetical protein
MIVKNMKEWHAEVCKGGRCQFCGRMFPENMLCGHHLKTRGAHPELKLETTNGRCTCLECHNKIHNGNINLTK